MTIQRSLLLKQLGELTQSHLKSVNLLRGLPPEVLNFKVNADSWSILECIEHLARYGNFYIPEITKRISNDQGKESTTFKSGLLGNYFAEMMLPKEGMKKIKTFKNMNPAGSNVDVSVLETFSDQLKTLIEILKMSQSKNLSRIKTSISISKLVKLRLGDTLRVVIYHNERHLLQVQNILKTTKAASATFVN